MLQEKLKTNSTCLDGVYILDNQLIIDKSKYKVISKVDYTNLSGLRNSVYLNYLAFTTITYHLKLKTTDDVSGISVYTLDSILTSKYGFDKNKKRDGITLLKIIKKDDVLDIREYDFLEKSKDLAKETEASDNIRKIYNDLKLNKIFGVQLTRKDLIHYTKILTDYKDCLSDTEYKKLKTKLGTINDLLKNT